MRFQTTATGALFLLVLLTWLLVRGMDTNAAAYAMTLRTFDDLQLAEASLRRDVLQARAGLLHDYDGLVASAREMEDTVAKLKSFVLAQRLDASPVNRLAAVLQREDELTERFKTTNALLQNSLSYVGLLSSTPAFGVRDPQLASETGALAAAVLYLTRDTSVNAVAALQQRIDRFASQARAEANAEPSRALLSHARLLARLLPMVDDTLKALISVPAAQAIDDVRSPFVVRQSEIEESSRNFRILLYLVSLLLLVALVFLGVRLRQRERERARLSLRLERARRMQMIGSLASGIAHNFNNIIGAILGYSEMLEPHLVRGSKPAQHADEMRKAAERARDLIDGILAFGRQRDTSAQLVEVRALFDDAASMLRASLPAEIELVVEDVPADAAVAGEPSQLQQVILNLCSNAAQAMQGKGRVRLSAVVRDVASFAMLSHGQLAPSRYVCLEVIDSGHGFDESVARRLFEPFFTTRAAGTGLGLPTVREIVEDHGGAMNVRSTPGEGSRFEAWLPAASVGVARRMLWPSKQLRGHGEAVLMVESDRDYRLRGEETLAALGYEPIGFANMTEAVDACRTSPDRFDALLVCHALRAEAVAELVGDLRTAAPRLPVLLAVASPGDGRARKLAEAGIVELVSRPLVSAELAAALARSLRHPEAR